MILIRRLDGTVSPIEYRVGRNGFGSVGVPRVDTSSGERGSDGFGMPRMPSNEVPQRRLDATAPLQSLVVLDCHTGQVYPLRVLVGSRVDDMDVVLLLGECKKLVRSLGILDHPSCPG